MIFLILYMFFGVLCIIASRKTIGNLYGVTAIAVGVLYMLFWPALVFLVSIAHLVDGDL